MVRINKKVVVVNEVKHNGRVAAFGPGDLGSNPGKDQNIIEFKLVLLHEL